MISDSTVKALEKARDLLADVPKGMEKALSRAYNEALITGRKVASQAITKEYTVKAKDAKSSFSMKRASRKDLNAELASKGKNLPLTAFAYRPKKDTTGGKKNRKQVRVSVKQDSGFTDLGNAFVHQGRIFKRLRSARAPMRKPLEMQFGPSVPGVLQNEKVREAVIDAINVRVEDRVMHHAKFWLEKHNTKG